jgi:quercetin dioxygenase-like cupin family protein
MSTLAASAFAPPENAAPQQSDRIYLADRGKFAQEFNRRPFMVDHSLAGHPAFSMDRLHQLLERSLPIPNKVYWNSGQKDVGQKWKERPGRDFSIEEAFQRIRESDAWIIIFGAECDPEIHGMLEQGMAEVASMAGISLNKEAKNTGCILFITSPRRVTQYHIDRECSMLLQVHGTKTIHVFDQNDRDVLTEPELERFWTVDNNAPFYKPEYQDRAKTFLLEPGKAVHIPVNAPHWLQNGDDISVSVNQNLQYVNDKVANIYRANYYARKMGLSPIPPGHSAVRDRIKAQSMKFPVFLGKKAVALKEHLKKK